MEAIDYDIKILDSPDEVRNMIIKKNQHRNRARILAGYCWNWPKQGRNDSSFFDIIINNLR